ncbi:MAG: nucleotide exchange factor GrpE [Bacteroidaceae bacterium]|jgi:molecular chaperone GrpE|nr:nucleotide exchange factor GrpE [Bacteroidaceae bacterium]
MKRKFNLKQNKNQKINMNSEEKKTEEMKNVEEETAEKNMEQPAAEEEQPVEGEAQQEAEEPEKELTPEEKLQAEVEKLQAEQEEMKDKYLRLSAEFDNYRKRTMKEKAELILNGGEKAFKAILPVIDDMERALATMQKATDVNAVKEGVDLIYNKFIQILGQNGVHAIDTKEKELDTDFHDAIAIIDAPSEELKGKILDCVETGYTLNDKVIRHAKVVVGK